MIKFKDDYGDSVEVDAVFEDAAMITLENLHETATAILKKKDAQAFEEAADFLIQPYEARCEERFVGAGGEVNVERDIEPDRVYIYIGEVDMSLSRENNHVDKLMEIAQLLHDLEG